MAEGKALILIASYGASSKWPANSCVADGKLQPVSMGHLSPCSTPPPNTLSSDLDARSNMSPSMMVSSTFLLHLPLRRPLLTVNSCITLCPYFIDTPITAPIASLVGRNARSSIDDFVQAASYASTSSIDELKPGTLVFIHPRGVLVGSEHRPTPMEMPRL